MPARKSETAAARGPGHHRDRADAALRLRRQAQLGLRRRAAVRAGFGLRPARGSEGADRRGARERPDGAARRRLQPLRPEGQLPAALRAAVLHRAAQDAVGRGDRLHERRRAPVFRPQRALLAGGVPLRRPALRRGARHHRRLAAPHPRRDRAPPRRLASTWCWRTTPTRRASSGPGNTPRSGTTTRTTPTTCSPPASPTATTSPTPMRPARHLARCLAEGFAYQGEESPFSKEPRGEPSAHLPTSCFVDFLQNHDQVGNRAFGERLLALSNERALKALSAIQLLAPSPPLLFMGEEWGCQQPFLFFCDFEGELGEAVRKGRREEFAALPPSRTRSASHSRSAGRGHLQAMRARLGQARRGLARALQAAPAAPRTRHRAAQVRPGQVPHARRARFRGEVGRPHPDRELRRSEGGREGCAAQAALWSNGEPGMPWSVNWWIST